MKYGQYSTEEDFSNDADYIPGTKSEKREDNDDTSTVVESESEDNTPAEAKSNQLLRAEFNRLSASDQESVNQERLDMQRLLSLDPTRIYKLEGLEDNQVLEQALRLLYLSKFGRDELYTCVSPHITYEKLAVSMARSIKERLQIEEQQIARSLALIAETLKI